jgi:G3E family GTPase
VIVNEFGEVGIDSKSVVYAEDQIVEMNNGCICCTVRGDLIRIIDELMEKRDTFDHLLIETTGLADPGPVIQSFFTDDRVRSLTQLDAIVTVVAAVPDFYLHRFDGLLYPRGRKALKEWRRRS